MNRAEIAVNKFKSGYNCAQSVLFSYADRLNIPPDLALKLATGFGGGMGRKQEVCGAVTGGILVLSLLYGRGEKEERAVQDVTYAKVRTLMNDFAEKHQTCICRQLLDGCELLTPAGQERFKSDNLIEKCCQYINSTVNILEKIVTR
jgi:C_GCAxxG_C_C family probable redox protein